MPRKSPSIPLNPLAEMFGAGIAIGKVSVKDSSFLEEAGRSHRDDYHLFFLEEKGSASIEIDFQIHQIKPSSLVYIHPNQVHRVVGSYDVTVSYLAINNENLKSDYLKLLHDIAPAGPLSLNEETFSFIIDLVSLCIKFSERKHEKLYHSLVKDSCNTLVALIVSQYLAQTKPVDKLSRSEIIAKTFRSALEREFITIKSPTGYARLLNLSTSYLNECVKGTTGYSVSYHIQQRIVLEAKRLLYHSDKSVKEIANELGFSDYPYFSRVFTKVTGMTALSFRKKNHE